jgi:hypothetical protein
MLEQVRLVLAHAHHEIVPEASLRGEEEETRSATGGREKRVRFVRSAAESAI